MKNKTRNRLLTIMLAIAISAVFMPAAALAEGEVNVTSHAEFVTAIANTEVPTINVTGDFALTADVEIDREVTITCTSDPGYTITTDVYSIIITGSEAVVDISGNLTLTGSKPIRVTDSGAADISGGTITAAGVDSSGVYVDVYSTVTVSGGTITAAGDGSSGVWVDDHSAVTVSGGTITAAGDESAGVFVRYNGTADIRGGTITAAGNNSGSVYVGSDGTAEISGGTITATGGGASSGIYVVNSGIITVSGDPDISGDTYGVYVDSGTAEISGGTVTATNFYGSIGIYVINGGTVTVSGESDIIGDENGVYMEGGTANISGGAITTARSGTSCVFVYGGGTVTVSDGTITAEGDGASCVYASGGDSTVTVSGGTITAEGDGARCVYVQGGDSTVTVSGGTIGATGTNSCGLYVDLGSTATISDEAKISGDAYGVYMDVGWNVVNVSVSVDLTISGGVYNYAGEAFLTDLLGPVAMTAGQTKTVELTGVDSSSISFEVDSATDTELAASITGSIVTLEPLETTPASTYNLVLYASNEGCNNFNLTIPVTVAVPDTVINLAAIAGVTAPVRDAAPVTAITATDQYTGTVSWSPAVIGDKFAADTAYTATITLTAKPGYTLTGVTANFFTVTGATSVNNDADSGVITAVFPATASESGGGGDDSLSPPNSPPPVNTNPNNAMIISGYINKKTGTTPDGKTVETFTVQNTAAGQIEQAKEEGKNSVEFNIAGSQTSVTDITIPAAVLESASGMIVSVSTPHATLELPAALVSALAAAGQDLNLTVTRGGEIADPEGGTVLGSTTEITTDIVGETQVTIPLAGVSIPADPGERAAFLNSLAVFTYHSDGETELITGEIIYDANGNPVSISFPVDKFSTFAIVKLSKRTVTLTIGSPAAGLNGLAVALDAPAVVEPQSNRTLVPLHFIGEALGAKVEWLPANRQVRIKDGEKEIFLTIDSQLALLNGQSVKIDCAPGVAPPGRTFLPLRFISEALGAEVAYDEATKGIAITREYGK